MSAQKPHWQTIFSRNWWSLTPMQSSLFLADPRIRQTKKPGVIARRWRRSRLAQSPNWVSRFPTVAGLDSTHTSRRYEPTILAPETTQSVSLENQTLGGVPPHGRSEVLDAGVHRIEVTINSGSCDVWRRKDGWQSPQFVPW